MVRGGFRHLIVVDGGELAGVLSMRDIVRVLGRGRGHAPATFRRMGRPAS